MVKGTPLLVEKSDSNDNDNGNFAVMFAKFR